MAVSNEEIQNWWASNSGLSDKDIAAAMSQYDVPLSQMIEVLGWNPTEAQSRYDAVTAPPAKSDPIADAWRNAESSGDYGAIAGLLDGMSGQQLMSAYGLNTNDLNYINSKAGTNLSAPGADPLADAWKMAESSGDYSKIAGLIGNKTGQDLMSLYGLKDADLNYINSKAGTSLTAATTPKPVVQLPKPKTTLTNVGGMSSNSPKQVDVVPRVMGPLPAPAADAGFNTWRAGAAGDEMLGAGNADYHSELLKSLRQSSITPFSNNAGVQFMQNRGASSANSTPAGNQALAFNPQVLSPRTASPQEVADWNAYSAYRTNALNSKTPMLSMAEWLAGGKTDGKPVTPEITPEVANWSGY